MRIIFAPYLAVFSGTFPPEPVPPTVTEYVLSDDPKKACDELAIYERPKHGPSVFWRNLPPRKNRRKRSQ